MLNQDQGNHDTDLDNFQSASEDGNPSESTETNATEARPTLSRSLAIGNLQTDILTQLQVRKEECSDLCITQD